jgi:hypothetical protein
MRRRDQVNRAIFEDDQGVARRVWQRCKAGYRYKVPVIADGMMSATAFLRPPICRENKVVFRNPDSPIRRSHPGGYIYRIAASDVINANVEAKFAYNVLKKEGSGIIS